jgi:hypothetical protein
MVPCGSILLGKWCSTFTGSSDSKMNVQSACALNTLYLLPLLYVHHYIQCLMDIVNFLLLILLHLFCLGSGTACLQQIIYSCEKELCLIV